MYDKSYSWWDQDVVGHMRARQPTPEVVRHAPEAESVPADTKSAEDDVATQLEALVDQQMQEVANEQESAPAEEVGDKHEQEPETTTTTKKETPEETGQEEGTSEESFNLDKRGEVLSPEALYMRFYRGIRSALVAF